MATRRRIYKSNSSTGVVRPPNASSFYLRSLKGTAAMYQQVRLRRKTTIWRMDLLKQKFFSIGFAMREPYYEVARQALVDARAKRAAALRDNADIVRPVAVAAPPSSVDDYPGPGRGGGPA